MALRFAVEFFKSVAIIIALPLGLFLSVQLLVAFVLLKLSVWDIEITWDATLADLLQVHLASLPP